MIPVRTSPHRDRPSTEGEPMGHANKDARSQGPAMPVENATAASQPSSSPNASSKRRTVGLATLS